MGGAELFPAERGKDENQTYEEAQASVERRQDKSDYLSSWADHLRSQNIFGPKNHVPDTRLSIQIAYPPIP